MAFFGKLGNILRHAAAANQKISSELRSSPSVFQAIRCMTSAPSSKLFVGGISFNTDEQSFREAFSKYGQVVDARIIMDRDSGRSRGFGFITYSSVEEASSAIQALDGQDLHGRQVRVNYATERARGFGGGGGGFGGSYGNAPYGGGAGTGYGGGYGNSQYGSGGGGYGDAGAYGGNPAGGYGGGGYGGGSYGSGSNYGGSSTGNNYSAPDSFGTPSAAPDSFGTPSAAPESFGTPSTGGGYSGGGTNYGNDGNFASGNTYPGGSSGGYGDNSGNFGVASGVGGNESPPGYVGSNSYAGAGSNGSGSNFAGGFDGSRGPEYGSSGPFDSKESNNVGEDLAGFGDSTGGNYRDDDDADNFAKRA